MTEETKKEKVSVDVTEMDDGNSLTKKAQRAFELFHDWKATSEKADILRRDAMRLSREVLFHLKADNIVHPNFGRIDQYDITRTSVKYTELKLAVAAEVGAEKAQELWNKCSTTRDYKEVRFHDISERNKPNAAFEGDE